LLYTLPISWSLIFIIMLRMGISLASSIYLFKTSHELLSNKSNLGNSLKKALTQVLGGHLS
jgi:nitric oxide reductase large subunit